MENEYRRLIKRQRPSLPIMLGDYVAVTAEGINMVDDQDRDCPAGGYGIRPYDDTDAGQTL